MEESIEVLSQQEANEAVLPILQSELLFWKAVTDQLAHEHSGQDGISDHAQRHLLEAEDILTSAAEVFPDDVDIRSALANIQLRRFDVPMADRIAQCENTLKTAIDELGDDASLRLSAAAAATLLPAHQAIPSLVELERENPAFTDQERAELLQGLAKAYVAIDDRETAIDRYTQAAELQPTSLRAPLAILQLLVQDLTESAGDIKSYASTWEAMLTAVRSIEGESGPYSTYYDATKSILTAASDQSSFQEHRGDVEAARQQLRAAQGMRPKWPAIPRMLGELAFLEGDEEAVIAHLEDAIKLGDRSETVVGRVTEFYLKEGREAEAKNLLDKVSRELPSLLSGRLAQLAWTVGRRLEENSITLGVLREQAYQSDDADTKILTALDYLTRGKTGPEVETLLREASELAPESPRAWLAIVNYHTRNYRSDLARDAIHQAEQRLPNDPPSLKPLTLARCYAILRSGDPDQLRQDRGHAEQHFRDAIAAAPEDVGIQVRLADHYTRIGEADKAQQIIAGLLAANSQATDAVRNWARRRQALIASSSGSLEEMNTALFELKQVDTLNDVDRIANLRAQLAIYTARNQQADRPEMLAILLKLQDITEKNLTNREQFQLAYLYEQLDRWSEAEQGYRDLVTQAPNDPASLGHFAAAFLRQATDENGLLEEVEPLVDRLESVEPNTYRTHALRARWLAQSGNAEQAADDLSEFVLRYADASTLAACQQIADETSAASAVETLKTIGSADSEFNHGVRQAEELLASGEESSALSLAKRLAASQFTVINLRCDTLKSAAEICMEFDQVEVAGDLYTAYAKRSSKPDALLELAKFMGQVGRWQEAIEICDTHSDEFPVETLGSLVATILRSNNVHDSSIVSPLVDRLRTAAVSEKSLDRKVLQLFALANLHDLQQNYELAEAAFGEILHTDPDNVTAANNLAYLWGRRQTNVGQAIQLIDHQLRLRGNKAELLDTKALLLVADGKPRDAVSLLTAVVEDVPVPEYFLHLAEAHSASGEDDAASKALIDAKDAGLTVKTLHPLDRRALKELRKSVNN